MAKKKAAKRKAPPAVGHPKQDAAIEQALDRIAWQKQIADELGVTVESVREWSQRPGFPLLGTADQVAAWRKVHIRGGGPPTVGQRKGINPFTDEGLRELEGEKAKNVQLKNEKLEEEIIAKRIANELKRRGLVPRAAVESFLRKLFSKAKSDIEGWPAEVVTSLPGRDRQVASDILQEKVRLLLLSMAGWEYEVIVNEEISDAQ